MSACARSRGLPPFPYTTLFRSELLACGSSGFSYALELPKVPPIGNRRYGRLETCATLNINGKRAWVRGILPCGSSGSGRSEEHTSELQSLRHLVCRLLLEKKTC